jgi:hypothetical protein
MPVSNYFNNYSGVKTNEQRLMEDVVTESIKIMGHDVYYIPRDSYDSLDEIFGEYAKSKFTRAYVIEAYLANVEGYEGDGDFFSKFGLEIRDTSNFIFSRRSFQRYIPSTITKRPREGDLVYVPVLEKLFEVKFVEEELMFFSLGKRDPYIYELRCELFRFNNEDLDTGVEQIDLVERNNSYTINLALNQGSGNYHLGEVVYQGANLAYATARAEVQDWIPANTNIRLINIIGSFTTGTRLIGEDSNTRYNIVNTDTTGSFVEYDYYENKRQQTEADLFIDFSENNPFGTP